MEIPVKKDLRNCLQSNGRAAAEQNGIVSSAIQLLEEGSLDNAS